MCVHQVHAVPTEDRGRHQTPWHWCGRCLEATMWLLGPREEQPSLQAHLIPPWLLLPWNHLNTMVMPNLGSGIGGKEPGLLWSVQLIPMALDKLLYRGGVMVQDSKLIKVIPTLLQLYVLNFSFQSDKIPFTPTIFLSFSQAGGVAECHTSSLLLSLPSAGIRVSYHATC